MKKVILVFLILFFLWNSVVFAYEDDGTVATDSASTEKEEEYTLPYPGILPDSPVYGLKIIRDRIAEFLINDDKKRSEFYLLAADKRLSAAILLMERKDKQILAQSTISKGINYLEKSLSSIEKADKKNPDTKDINRKIVKSLKKHRKEIQLLEKNSKKEFKDGFSSLLKRIDILENRINNLSL